jgi:hypothetical protein
MKSSTAMAMVPEDMTHLNFMKKQQWNVRPSTVGGGVRGQEGV